MRQKDHAREQQFSSCLWPIGFILLWGLGCSHALVPESVSAIDAQYQLQRNSTQSQANSITVDSYRALLGPVLASRCHWFPSDSQYSRQMIGRCGIAQGMTRGFARFLSEPDAAQMGYAVFQKEGRLVFADLPNACD